MAKEAAKLGPQPPQKPQKVWEFTHEGEVFQPPHKVWTHEMIPKHSNVGIHPISFSPLKSCSAGWAKWIFGHVWRPGYAHFCTFWSVPPKSSKLPCKFCGKHHNASVHGVIAFCNITHSLVQAWITAWGTTFEAIEWRLNATADERRLTGKLCIPFSLYKTLSAKLGRSKARKKISDFQGQVLRHMDAYLSEQPSQKQTRHPKRPSPWKEEDYDHGLPSLPLAPVWKRKKA